MRSLVIVVAALGVFGGGCKKKDGACAKKCKKMLACYEETRGAVKDDSSGLRRCTRICEGKSASRYKKAIGAFESLSCLEFMKKYRAEASFLMNPRRMSGERVPGKKGPAQGGLDASEHPFPKLQSRPPSDPKERRGWRSNVQKNVDRIVIQRTDATIELKRTQPGDKPGDMGTWELVQPQKAPADRFAIRNLITRLERMVFRSRADDIKSADFPRHGLDDKTGIRCKVYAGETVIADMIIGKPERGGAGAGAGARRRAAPRGQGGITTLIRKAETNDVYRVMGSLSYIFKRAASGWRDATVIDVKREDLAKLSLKVVGGTLVLKRDPNEQNPRMRFTNWEIVSATPALTNLDQSAVTRLVSVLTRLRATSFITDPKVAETGLDKPRGTVELTDKAGKVITLLIGNKDGKRRAAFAQIKDDKRVFLVRHPLDELPEESIGSYRDKALVDAKVGEITTFQVVKEGESVKFVRDGRAWKASEPAGLNFDRNKLMGTIRMLEGRFSAHKFADKTDSATTGLGASKGRIVVTVQAPKKPARTVELLVGKSGPRGDFYVQVKGQSEVYLVRRWVLNRVFLGAKEWTRQARPAGGMRP